MKSLYLRSGLALLCAVILSACGGGDGSLQLTVSLSGVTKDGLVLTNTNTGELLPVPIGTSIIAFTKLAGTDEQFNIQIKTPPANATCTLTDNTGKANAYTAYRIVVSCTNDPYTLGGVVYGLKSNGLVLANGPDTVGVVANGGADVAYTFPTKVPNGSPFGVTVLSQPAGQTCTVDPTKAVGNMPATDALQMYVTCK
ncbi:hypothetical protein ACEN9F_21500 [Duganella sp. CT11-25]|jgi:ABC-type Fe3+-hydroxamate transport system substrate-binding protein|uniref:hypothetical protein n=1 Tax=unclassified Duganella TaxID=2636909 RepID=UPI0039AF9F23